MTRNHTPKRHSAAARLCIWSIRRQRWLAGQLRIYLFAGAALVAFLALGGVISIETAIFASFCTGLIVAGLIWTLIHQRKLLLLNLQDNQLRQEALTAMVDYLHQINHEVPTSVGAGGAPGGRSRNYTPYRPS